MTIETSLRQGAADPSSPPIRVVIVDDSAVVRGLMRRMLDDEPDIEVVASVSNGKIAVDTQARSRADIVLLDIEMPVMDGLTALPLLLKAEPHLQVIMASTLTARNAEISLKALELGAADYIPKPSSSREMDDAGEFRRDMLSKIRTLGRRARARRTQDTQRGEAAGRPATLPARSSAGLAGAGQTPVKLRFAPVEAPEIIAIGASTGGPQALVEVIAGLKSAPFPQPILITQHMPATFTAILAQHLERAGGREAHEAKDGEAILARHIYVAPGNFHMVVEQRGPDRIIRLNQDPPENFCRPSVDPMLRSIAAAWGKKVLVAILTGMGADGMKGSEAVVAAGGSVIAQDEATSVVWGMPGAVANAGLCSALLPLREIPQFLLRHALRR